MISGSRWLTLRGYQLRAALSVSHLGRKTPSSLRAAVGLGGAQQRLLDLDVADQLAEVLLDVLELADADGVGDLAGQAEVELGLGEGAGDDLVGHQGAGAGLGVPGVAQFGVAEHEDAVVRDEHVVEDDDRVHLLEPGRQGLVERAAAVMQRRAAVVLQAGAVVRDRERERVRRVLGGAAQHRGREDKQFVGDRAEGGEQPRAADRRRRRPRSSTMRAVSCPPACWLAATDRLTCGGTRVWVASRSFSRAYS